MRPRRNPVFFLGRGEGGWWRVHRPIGLGLIVLGGLLLLNLLPLQIVPEPTPSYSVAEVTQQGSRVVISGAWGHIVGPQPDGTYTYVFTVSYLWCSGDPQPQVSWRWPDGATSNDPVASRDFSSLIPQLTVELVVSGTDTAKAKVTVFSGEGESKVIGAGAWPSGCPPPPPPSESPPPPQQQERGLRQALGVGLALLGIVVLVGGGGRRGTR